MGIGFRTLRDLRQAGAMLGALSSADKAAIDAWAPETRRRGGALRVAGTAALMAVVVGVGLLGGDTGSSLSDELPGSLRRQVRRLRRGRPVTALLWHREQGAGASTGPSAVTVRSDYSCRFEQSGTTLDLQGARLVELGLYSGLSPNRFEPIPTNALFVRLRIAPRPDFELIGDRSNLAALGVLCRWPSPPDTTQ